MITVSDKATFNAPVTVLIPGPEGVLDDQTATFKFKFFTHSEFTDLNGQLREKKLSDPEFMKKIIVGWGEDVVGEDGKAVPFNEENFEKVIEVHGLVGAIIKTYFAHVNSASAKNLKALLSSVAAAE